MVPAEKEKALRKLVELFLHENTKVNLSAFRTEQDCWIGNVLDSLTFLDICKNPHLSIVDIGTGGGFPLLPLAICLPDAEFTGIDSTKKKIDAVQRITCNLQLSNVQLIWGRAEDHKQRYDVVLARAVAPLNKLLQLAVPLAKPDGAIIFWKSTTIDKELKESEKTQDRLGWKLVGTHEYVLPEYGMRQLLVFKTSSFFSSSTRTLQPLQLP